MHVSELVQLAAMVAQSARTYVEGGGHGSRSGLELYWTASRCRLDRWTHTLKCCGKELTGDDPLAARDGWSALLPTLEEIITSDVLTRVWTAVAAEHARRHADDGDALLQSIYMSHQETRNRALRLMLKGQGVGIEQAVSLNRLRRRTERWTDMLIGSMHQLKSAVDFAIDPERAREFARDVRHEERSGTAGRTWPLMLTALRSSLQKALSPESACGDLNAEIASAVLSCFGSHLFDSTGQFKSLWLVRLSNHTADAQGMVADLLAELETDETPSRGRFISSRP